MRILHLIDGGVHARRAWRATPTLDIELAAVALLGRRLRHEQTAFTIGPRALLERAAATGINVLAGAPSPGAAISAVERTLAAFGPFDALHAWGPDAVTPALAAAEAPGAGRIPVFALATPGRPDADGAVTVIDSPPPVAPRPDAADRARLRAALGLTTATTAVLLLGDPPRADAVRFAFLLSLIAVAGIQTVGLIPASSAQVARADRLMRSSPRVRIVVTDRPFRDLLAAADAAVFEGGGHGPTSSLAPAPGIARWPIAAAHTAGVPVVAPAWAAPDFYPADAAEAALSHNATIPDLARRLMPIVTDAALRSGLSASVRAHLEQARADRRFCDAVEHAWETVAEPANP
jgi:hypothetical protein